MKPYNHGQISIEVMYSVGVMVIVFMILLGISFTRRGEVTKLEDYLNKRNECLRIANFITGVNNGGQGTSATLYIYHNVSFVTDKVIQVTEAEEEITTIDATCTYIANVTLPTPPTLQPLSTYLLENKEGIILITKQ